MNTFNKLLLLLITCFVGVNSFAQNKYDSSYTTTYYLQKTSLFKLLPKSKQDIIFLGNSITDIAEWAEVWQNKNVKNRGISSDNTFGVLARLNDVVIGTPAKIFIMIGINDIARNIPDSVIVANYKKIIDIIITNSPKTKLFIQSILPTNNDFKDFKNHQNKTEHIVYINEQLQKICAYRKISFVNLYPHFLDENGKLSKSFTNDGLHLTGEGYMFWKKIVQEKKLM
jgi:lysophospholipase L1-like esterase